MGKNWNNLSATPTEERKKPWQSTMYSIIEYEEFAYGF